MNREFVVKMMKAKKLEFEAIKEIMPEKMASQINDLEKVMLELVKECILSELTEEEADEPIYRKSTGKKVQKVVVE